MCGGGVRVWMWCSCVEVVFVCGGVVFVCGCGVRVVGDFVLEEGYTNTTSHTSIIPTPFLVVKGVGVWQVS